MNGANRTPTKTALRMRRYRDRQRRNVLPTRGEAPRELAEILIERGNLPASVSADPEHLADAILAVAMQALGLRYQPKKTVTE